MKRTVNFIKDGIIFVLSGSGIIGFAIGFFLFVWGALLLRGGDLAVLYPDGTIKPFFQNTPNPMFLGWVFFIFGILFLLTVVLSIGLYIWGHLHKPPPNNTGLEL